MATETKLKYLEDIFSSVGRDVLLEILISCDGSVEQTESLLSEQFPVDTKRKAKSAAVSGHQKKSKYQRSISQLIDSNSLPTKVESTSKKMRLFTKEEIEASVPYVTFKRDFLPAEVANSLLEELLSKQDIFTPNTFFIAGNKCVANHKTKVFTASDDDERLQYDVELSGGKLDMGSFGDSMRIVQCLVEDEVEALSQSREKHDFQPKTKWTGDIVVANLFCEKSSNLDWHSDRLTKIGPLPVIASISVGATRDFRIRKIHPFNKNPNPIISIPLPHNTLLVMHAGFQEEYKHSVAPSSGPIEGHPISGQKRFSLTYRQYHPGLVDCAPTCSKCGSAMLLRRMYKKVENRGKYYWSCMGSYANKECKGFYWANFRNLDTPNSKVYTTEESECSEWIADDDTAKAAYLMTRS
ncbi:unnamed protein product [Kuraishia capsulata CBS 1993]|uniref:Fe2OG dioxygenase domain-containing protein n=1 Tax=Kuraishia capsulata CBS 1993 TaxID=1382522 RepID=W6MP16_9ASCO|nr:uncharacterized protein KUCA_T00002791001 [Kuraishia capsulata CBS 1993]CDK26817.1 unnamed protein product [Kuraishia capsulata CBS 1993]